MLTVSEYSLNAQTERGLWQSIVDLQYDALKRIKDIISPSPGETHLTVSKRVSYKIIKTPFESSLRWNGFWAGTLFSIRSQWFRYTEDESDGTIQSGVESRSMTPYCPVLERRLFSTEPGFMRQYPNGILMDWYPKKDSGKRLYQVVPQFLYSLGPNAAMYRKESYYLSVLMNDTFEYEIIGWNDKV